MKKQIVISIDKNIFEELKKLEFINGSKPSTVFNEFIVNKIEDSLNEYKKWYKK